MLDHSQNPDPSLGPHSRSLEGDISPGNMLMSISLIAGVSHYTERLSADNKNCVLLMTQKVIATIRANLR